MLSNGKKLFFNISFIRSKLDRATPCRVAWPSITADERNPSFTVHFNFISRSIWSGALAVVIFSALNIAPLYLFTRVIHNRKVASNRKHIHGCGHCYSVSRQDAPRRLYRPPITPLHTLSCVLLIFRDNIDLKYHGYIVFFFFFNVWKW